MQSNRYDINIAVGEVLRNYRELARFSQEELAACSGYDRAYISTAELGRTSLTVGALHCLCHALGVPVHQLLREAEEKLRHRWGI